MRKLHILLALLGVLIPTACYCGVSENSAQPAVTPKLADARLEQKVTYSSGYKRLYAVVSDLSQATGVKITAGANSLDWHIRDIPVAVYVKDMSLGSLLNALAESTHLSIMATDIEKSGDKAASRTYRLYRPKKTQDTIDRCNQIAHGRQLEEIDWAWDALSKLTKLPQAQQIQLTHRPIRLALAQIIAALGTDAKTRIMNGETITIQATDSKYASIMANLCNAHWEQMSEVIKTPLEKPTQEQIEALSLAIKLQNGGEDGDTDITALSSMDYGTTRCPFSSRLRMFAAELEKVPALNLPPRPKGDFIIDPADDCPRDKSLVAVDLNQKPPSDELDIKIKAYKPKEGEPFRYTEFLAELAKSTNLNIVSEDFLSHSSNSPNFTDVLNHDTTLIDALRTTTGIPWFTWFANQNSKLLVGWALIQGWWVKSHKNLAPESMVNKLIAKQDIGVELEDILPLLDLPEGQRNTWFNNHRDIEWIVWAFRSEKPLWQLYKSLAPSEKELAITTGFPLGRLGPVRVSDFLKKAYDYEHAIAYASNDTASSQDKEALINPDVISRAVLHLRRTPSVRNPAYGKTRPGEKQIYVHDLHHSYALEITCEEDNAEKVLCTAELGISLPVYSATLENKLFQELRRKVQENK